MKAFNKQFGAMCLTALAAMTIAGGCESSRMARTERPSPSPGAIDGGLTAAMLAFPTGNRVRNRGDSGLLTGASNEPGVRRCPTEPIRWGISAPFPGAQATSL